jgi:hypothetical protein
MARTTMSSKERQPDARPVFRWLAALTCPVFVLMAIITAFPQLVGEGKSSFLLAALFAWGAVFFGSIAATGKYETDGKQRHQLLLAAKKHVDGQTTLEEYSARTKEILDGH